MLRRSLLPVLLLSAAAAVGCDAGPPPMPPPKPPDVVVSPAVEDVVTDYEEFQGKTQGLNEIDVKAHVSGYLDTFNFTEGALVHKNDVLFQIDPRPFEAALAQAKANLEQAEAHAKRLAADYDRNRTLYIKGGVSREEWDKITGDRQEADAAVGVARAMRDTAQLNLTYSRVTSPIDGKVSRRMVDPGNMVKADDTVLTHLCSIDPMYAYFDIDERTYLNIKSALEQAGYSRSQQKALKVFLGLSNEKDFPHEGVVDFVDTGANGDSGSVWLRAVFPNKDRRVAPGLFVRVRLPVSDPHPAVLISERALATDQGQKFVWVVDDQNHAAYRRIQLGPQHGPRRTVEKGIKPGERVIVSGLQRVRNDPKKGYAEVEVLKEVPCGAEPEGDATVAKAGH
jgi:RND family efflux transporter MFP subunit